MIWLTTCTALGYERQFNGAFLKSEIKTLKKICYRLISMDKHTIDVKLMETISTSLSQKHK
jgi:hypothetical protein